MAPSGPTFFSIQAMSKRLRRQPAGRARGSTMSSLTRSLSSSVQPGGTLLADMAHARGEGPVVVARGCGVYTISGQQPGFVLALSHCQSLSRDPTTTLHPGDCSLHPFKAGQAKRPAVENPRHCANCWCFVCQVLVMRPFALAFGRYPCSQCRSDAVRARSCVWQVPVAQCQQWSQIPAHCNAHGRFLFWVKLRQRQWQNNGDLNTVTNAHHMGL